MEIFLHSENWVALLTLTVLEIILGVDNILFISIISEKLPVEQRAKARKIGLALALVFRILLLLAITWLVHFTDPLFSAFGLDFSGRDLILLSGGVFLLVKTIGEIHKKVNTEEESNQVSKKPASFGGVIGMIVLVDMVFSFDSILTAVGMIDEVLIMIIAVVISMILMMVFINKISTLINNNPSLQMLALSFLILISFVLILDGLHKHIERGYVYFALFFSLSVEFLNIRRQKKRIKGTNKT